MPSEATPRILRGSIVSSGSFAPIVATGIDLPFGDVRRGGRDRQRAFAPMSIVQTCEPVGVRMFLDLRDAARRRRR